ncbi:MAG: hypothetical protein IPH13_21670 [Planctomycetes bacterium]|nr:hypothetical protein [Planctomycetota bacterium]
MLDDDGPDRRRDTRHAPPRVLLQDLAVELPERERLDRIAAEAPHDRGIRDHGETTGGGPRFELFRLRHPGLPSARRSERLWFDRIRPCAL